MAVGLSILSLYEKGNSCLCLVWCSKQGSFFKYSIKWGIFQQQIVTTLLRRASDTTLQTKSPKFYLKNGMQPFECNFLLRLLYLCGVGAAKGFLFQYQSKSKFFFFLLLPRVSLWKSLRNPWSEVSKYFPTKIHWNLAPAVQQPTLDLANPLSKIIQFSKMLECEDEEILWMATDCFKSRDARVCASLHVCIMDIEGVGYPSLVAHILIFQPQSDKRRRILKVHTSGAI